MKGISGFLVWGIAVVFSPAAVAATADNVICNGCIHSSDIKAGAVKTADMKNGAVTHMKLAPDVRDTIEQLQATVQELQATVAQLQRASNQHGAVLQYFSDTALTDPNTGELYPTVRISGANLQIVNGLNETSTVNGTGNLIVGYNENKAAGATCSMGNSDNKADCEGNNGVWAVNHRNGSHNMISGHGNNYSRYGGVVGGQRNTVNGVYAAVLSGRDNVASHHYSSVSGGQNNRAGAAYSSVLGGNANTAAANHSTVSGGDNNVASGDHSNVSGGAYNEAGNNYSSVSGGYSNTVNAAYGSILGGGNNTVIGRYGGVSGGRNNTANGNYSHVSGGFNRVVNGNYDWRAGSLFENQ